MEKWTSAGLREDHREKWISELGLDDGAVFWINRGGGGYSSSTSQGRSCDQSHCTGKDTGGGPVGFCSQVGRAGLLPEN